MTPSGKDCVSGMLSLAGKTDVGLVRENNEDAFISKNIWDGKYSLAVVIDGIGGYEGGEVASALAAKEVCDYLDEFRTGDPGRLLAEAVNAANNAIFEEKRIRPEYSRMGCVLTAALSDGNTLYTAHVGDTRLYLARGGKLTKLTHDHSLIGYREEIGDLSEEEAMNHPMRNVISRDLGECLHNSDDDNWIETSSMDLRPGDVLLLCSDGLSDLLTSREMLSVLEDGKPLEERAVELVAKALEKGGKDNVTVVLMQREGEPEVDYITVETVEPEVVKKKNLVSLIIACVLLAALLVRLALILLKII